MTTVSGQANPNEDHAIPQASDHAEPAAGISRWFGVETWSEFARNPLDYWRPRTVRIGVTGLARAGKTVLLTALAATLLAPGALGGRLRRVRLADLGANPLPRFPFAANLAALAADPPRWPDRTDATALLALDLELGRPGLPGRSVRLEFLDYPGEWLLDLPMLVQDFRTWSRATLTRMRTLPSTEASRAFLAFAQALPASTGASDALAQSGHDLYVRALNSLRAEHGLSWLQPGRFMMPGPGAAPAWMAFFPLDNASSLAGLLGERYDAYRQSVRDGLVAPLFGQIDRLVVLADLLGALHTGPAAFEDARAALAAASESLRWQGSWVQAIGALAQGRLPPRTIRRVAYVASKADHVSERQRGNLRALMDALTNGGASPRSIGEGSAQRAAFAVASARCTEDFVWSLDGHPVSAVRGRLLGDHRMTRSYPGEVPDAPPDAAFWTHPFLSLPVFEPARLQDGGRHGIPNIGLDALLGFLLEDLL
ncbi:YcjX family protein [Tanticharoenia sakaeratensis]|uniref:Amino acid regulated cytosolic protein n=1 Tax=Tanticharoenia sakaeratensis NBRC 103193 TaxID=1231623 RepID=A0A0D6MMX6_9PROT|nr:YcjX family protein [Tanticharoenia sakaeratensis]GAN54786.1 amino acid regulated cytosolic protein [Tanticharoenia sakaeratensis NBRC 103193]GBQ21561.1 amino acid regulated cytosolic protein [Tanticharoenia sakaeratensis NBRC 103193]